MFTNKHLSKKIRLRHTVRKVRCLQVNIVARVKIKHLEKTLFNNFVVKFGNLTEYIFISDIVLRLFI